MKSITLLKGFTIVLVLLTTPRFLFAQQDNTLFFLHSVPESNFTNPAVQIHCPYYIGMPILNSLHLNLNSTGFSYKSFSPGEASIDIDKLVSKMHSWDYLTAELHYTPFSFGYMYDKKQYINFAYSEKIDAKLFYPKKLVLLAKDGNTQYVGDGLRTRNPGLNAIYYREFALGYSKKVNRKLVVGGHAKILFGLAGIITRRNPVELSVNSLTYDINASWNPRVNVAFPLDVSVGPNGYVNGVGAAEVSPAGLLLNFKNQGLAADVGFIYKDKKVTWSGSMLDLGLIWWHNQQHRFSNKGDFRFRGATLADGLDPNAYMNLLLDSLENQMRVQETSRGFISLLSPRIYFGATYPVHDQIKVGAHTRTELYPGRPTVGITFMAMATGQKGSTVQVNYSIMNGSFFNIGFGLGWGGEQFQFYAMSDNVMAFFFPESARNANIRFGFNFFTGCHEKKKRVKIPKYEGCGCYGIKYSDNL